jgi:hypothetical protein
MVRDVEIANRICAAGVSALRRIERTANRTSMAQKDSRVSRR